MSPVTSKVVSRVTASSTFNVPFIVVANPAEAILTTPSTVANEVAPVESNVLTLEISLSPISIFPVMVPPASASFSVSNSASAA